MTRRRILALVLALLLIGGSLVILRWPRLPSGGSLFTSVHMAGDSLDMDFRMDRPFQCRLVHSMSSVPKPPEDKPSGILLGKKGRARREKIEVFSSRYDYLRGEHSIRLVFRRGDDLSASCHGKTVHIPIWCGKPAQEVEWDPPGSGMYLGNGNGIYPVMVRINEEPKEKVELVIGTEDMLKRLDPVK